MRWFLGVIALCATMVSLEATGFPPSILPPGLVAAYSLNEGSGETAADLSGHDNIATLTFGPAWTAGKHGNALSFDGADDSQNLGSPEILANVNTFTYCAWVYPRSMGGQSDGRIMHKGSNSQRKQFNIDDSATNSLGLRVDRTTSSASAISLPNALSLNQWQYVCATYSEIDGP